MQCILLAALSLAAAHIESGLAQSADPRQVDRAAVLVAATPAFNFHSDPLLNLHDFLLWRAHTNPPPESRAECIAQLRETEQSAWQQAESHYQNTFGPNARQNSLLVALRYELAGFPEVNVRPDSLTGPVLAHVRAALPAYRACWWADHDRRNRAWIAQVLPRLRAHEDSIKARLARVYQLPWPEPIAVDLGSYVNFGGASTLTDPHHIMISAVDSSYRGDSALEMVFHEASHTVVSSGPDGITKALQDSTVLRGHAPARDLPHVLLFYTAGHVTQQRLRETGTQYSFYLYREGLFERAWPAFRMALERYWQPYLDGRVDLASALREVVARVPQQR